MFDAKTEENRPQSRGVQPTHQPQPHEQHIETRVNCQSLFPSFNLGESCLSPVISICSREASLATTAVMKDAALAKESLNRTPF
jgi:hypothetical protein